MFCLRSTLDSLDEKKVYYLVVDSRALVCLLFVVAEIGGLDGDIGKRSRALEHGARQKVHLQGATVLLLQRERTKRGEQPSRHWAVKQRER